MRDIQERAIEQFLTSDEDVIIAAATAGGKTEAAFLPLCSPLVDNAEGSVRLLYLSPLKALINDQYERLCDFTSDLGIDVHRWHGDVAASKKKSLVEDPRGILLMTPESLEALFVTRGTQIQRVFRDLSHVIVDELHSFIGSERGRQLQSLLHRLELILRRRITRIGLSATLGDMNLAAAYLRHDHPDSVHMIISDEEGQEVKLQIRGYLIEDPGIPTPKSNSPSDKPEPPSESLITERQVASHLFKTLRGSHNLIFSNRRAEVEIYADLMRQSCEELHVPTEFWPHHGSLSKELREDVEARLKNQAQPASAVCTSTLEMGIDIGSVSSIAQIRAPFSVAGMRQRLGRSGRRGEPAVLRIYILEPEITDQTPVQDTLRAQLVQAVAMVRLLIEKWYEPPVDEALHLSTLIQQALSIIAQYGGGQAQQIWSALCESGPFRGLTSTDFAALLRHLGTQGVLMQSPDGTLLPGPLGERTVNHYTFFTAFITAEEYRLTAGGKTLGTLPIDYPLAEGCFVIFAGRRWQVIGVDFEQRVVDVIPASGGRPPRFGGEGGQIRDRVREEMLKVYLSDDLPSYLNQEALLMLTEARSWFERHGLRTKVIVPNGGDVLLFPWKGDRVMNTIALQLMAAGVAAIHEGLAIRVSGVDAERLSVLLGELAQTAPANPVDLTAKLKNMIREKYDAWLPDDLLRRNYASSMLDTEGAWRAVQGIAAGGRTG